MIGPNRFTENILVRPVISQKKVSINQNNGLKFVQIAMPNKEVTNPIADVTIHRFNTRPGNNQLSILNNLLKTSKFDFLIIEKVRLILFLFLLIFLTIVIKSPKNDVSVMFNL